MGSECVIRERVRVNTIAELEMKSPLGFRLQELGSNPFVQLNSYYSEFNHNEMLKCNLSTMCFFSKFEIRYEYKRFQSR